MSKTKSGLPLPTVVIGEPESAKEKFEANLNGNIAAAIERNAHPEDCKIRHHVEDHPNEFVPEGQSREFLRGYFAGLTLAFSTCNVAPLSAMVQHILVHAIELVGGALAPSESEKAV